LPGSSGTNSAITALAAISITAIAMVISGNETPSSRLAPARNFLSTRAIDRR
jgi:hypothetical protein